MFLYIAIEKWNYKFMNDYMKKPKSMFYKFTGVIALTLLLIAGCGDDNTTTPNDPQGNTPTLSGSVSNYPGGSMIVKAKINAGTPTDSFFVGIDTLDNSGIVNMPLATPPSNFLVAFGTVPSGVVISDTTTRATQVGNLRAYGFSNELIGDMMKKNYTDSAVVGSFVVQYLYSTKPFTITGVDTNANLTDTSIYVYNITFTSGWNAFTFRITEQRTNYVKYEYVTGEAAGATWYYTPSIIAARNRGLFLLD